MSHQSYRQKFDSEYVTRYCLKNRRRIASGGFVEYFDELWMDYIREDWKCVCRLLRCVEREGEDEFYSIHSVPVPYDFYREYIHKAKKSLRIKECACCVPN